MFCFLTLTFWLMQLLPLLASSLEFGSAAAPALTALLKMGSWLSTEDFSVKVCSAMLNFCLNALYTPMLYVYFSVIV